MERSKFAEVPALHGADVLLDGAHLGMIGLVGGECVIFYFDCDLYAKTGSFKSEGESTRPGKNVDRDELWRCVPTLH